jgi:hypothetical protein
MTVKRIDDSVAHTRVRAVAAAHRAVGSSTPFGGVRAIALRRSNMGLPSLNIDLYQRLGCDTMSKRFDNPSSILASAAHPRTMEPRRRP